MNIKRLLLFAVCFSAMVSVSFAAPVWNAPAVRIQPNGDTLRCLLSGDEYYHRLHDEAGYTIVQNPRTGWWVYATKSEVRRTDDGERWDVVATDYVAGRVNPALVGLMPNVGVDRETWESLQHRYDVPKEYAVASPKTSGRNHGTMNNIVIYVRFSDETEISTPLSTIDAMFNDSSTNATSMYNYFKHASYNKIFIRTYYYPTPNGNNIISYQDSLPRSYYQPYDSTTNTNGYQNDNERREREFDLLERAVNYVNNNSPVSSSLNLDMDNDGYVDNICFVVKGTYTGWSDLLWPHKWSLYNRYVYINGKRVYTFNLQLEGSGSHYFSSSTFCHEMFHTLGAPDLYRYDNYTNVSGVGSWDLMCSNSTPPQHMSAYMKWKYGNWLDSIPEIRIQGTYTLHSLADPDYSNCAYKIAAQEPHQWYVFEYRDNTELFETALPGKGLLIFRIDDRYNGNASYDGQQYFDEVYLFRPNANNDTTNGTLAQAYFSGSTSRTQFTPSTNPHPWLTGNVLDSTISITNITVPGETISFTYTDLRGCITPRDLRTSDVSGTSAHLSWNGNAASYTLQWKVDGSSTTNTENINSSSFTLTNLALNTAYKWRVKGNCSATDESGYSNWMSFSTHSCLILEETSIGTASAEYHLVPLNTYYNYTYSQMIYTPAEIGSSMEINKIAYNYTSSNHLDSKNNVTVYMGHTTQSSFSGTNASSLVPVSQLTVVYEGPFDFTTGWNTIELDNAFFYNSDSNLVIAVDDNSGDYNGNSYKFACTPTTNYMTLTYYSDNDNPNPYNPSGFNGNKSRKLYRPDIKFIGCPEVVIESYTISASVIGDGSVDGDGDYDEGSTCTLTASAGEHWHFSHWLSENDSIYDNPYSFTVVADRQFTAYFVKDQHHISVSVDQSSAGYGYAWFTTAGIDGQAFDAYLDYGTEVTLYAEPRTDIPNTVCSFVGWSDGDNSNPRTLTLTTDTEITASFSAEQVGIEEVEGNIRIAVAGHNVTVDDAEGRAVEVMDITGRILERRTENGELKTIVLPAAGVYLLRVEGIGTKKIVIK